MSEDTFPTPDPFPAPEEEELEAANALRQALEGRPAGSRVPEEALQTAAFLRHAGDGGRLSSERRAKLRAELLASLPAAPARGPRKSWRDWLGIGITLVGAASAAVTVGVLGVREWSSQDRASQARSAAMESEAMETAAPGDEGSAMRRGAASGGELPAELPPVAAPELATAPAPRELAEAPAVTSDGAPMSGQRALGGLGRTELEAPASTERRRAMARAMASGGAAAPGGNGPSAARAASKRTQSAEAPALASKAAPADVDDAQGAGSGLAAAERKGGGAPTGAVASAPPGGAANLAAPAKEMDTAAARVARQRQDQRSRLLARLANTPAPGAYRDADGARSVAELERARERLTALSAAGLGGTSSAAEAEQLRPDVYCRLAEIDLRLGQPRAALDWVRQGLALGSEPSPFVACLYQQQGRAREALGDRNGAGQSYMNALKVNERLLDESLEGP